MKDHMSYVWTAQLSLLVQSKGELNYDRHHLTRLKVRGVRCEVSLQDYHHHSLAIIIMLIICQEILLSRAAA